MKNVKNYSLLFKLTLLTTVILISCGKEDFNNKILIRDGYYTGYFAYSGDTIWEAISFKEDTFKEVPSGGLPMDMQKFPCIVEGLYNIKNGNINFNVYKYPSFDKYPPPYELCDSDIYLCGDYTIEISKEEFFFWKGGGNFIQTYKLKLKY